jgi:biotin synthase
MSNGVRSIMEITDRILNGRDVTPEEARQLIALDDQNEIFFLLACANRIRTVFLGDQVEFCAIVNAKSGRCSEDCAFCAQSSHYRTAAPVYPLMDEKAILEAAKKAAASGACRFSIVTSGKGVQSKKELGTILKAVESISKEGIRTCASLGLIDEETAIALRDAGVTRYHHNLETAASYYPAICSTHTFGSRVATVEAAYKAGLEVCSGGILGLGESLEQRVEFAFQLKRLPVASVPLNFLNPIPGTPLENRKPLAPLEALKAIALFRFIMPNRDIRTCGGREISLKGLQPLMYIAGCNGSMIGDYLTTEGREPSKDLQDVKDLKLTIKG